jgi:crotonobetainyl-CoA:carnitine CoA-transferase CaiB-like acyl-CoA transferase
VFADPQVQQQQLRVAVDHPSAGTVDLLGIPFALSETPAAVRLPPPLLGQHTEAILLEAGCTASEIATWQSAGIV